MKPVNIFGFAIMVCIVLGIIMLAFPKEGIIINDDYKLQFPAFNEFFNLDRIEHKDITAIISNQIDIDTIITIPIQPDSLTADTINQNTPINNESPIIDAVALKKMIHPLEFQDNDPSVLYPFFHKLNNLTKSNELIRIMHYGDSQIENDRITAFLRNRLQKRFGGCGPGLQSAVQLYSRGFSIQWKCSDNWQRYTVFGKVDTNIRHKRYGAMATFSRYAPLLIDTTLQEDIEYQAWLSYSSNKISYSNTRKFKNCKIFYGNNKHPVYTEVHVGDSLLYIDTLTTNEVLNVFPFTFGHYTNEVSFRFGGADSPDIYAIALDDVSGIAVDNIALRGSSGTIFTKIDQEQLKQMYEILNIRLFILQFGGNVMPYIKNDKNITNYGNMFYYQLLRLKKLCPQASIIVIGPSDMSTKIKENYETYECLEKIRDALKHATFKAGGAYWDMYEAMGGRNSMPAWVNADPPLAASDYTHFSLKGIKIISNMFYNALMFEYNAYQATN